MDFNDSYFDAAVENSRYRPRVKVANLMRRHFEEPVGASYLTGRSPSACDQTVQRYDQEYGQNSLARTKPRRLRYSAVRLARNSARAIDTDRALISVNRGPIDGRT